MSKVLLSRPAARTGPLRAVIRAATSPWSWPRCAPCRLASPPPYVAVNHQRLVPLAAPDVWRRLARLPAGPGHPRGDRGRSRGPDRRAPGGGGQGPSGLLRRLRRFRADCCIPWSIQTLDLTLRVKPEPDGTEVTANAAFSQTLKARKAGAAHRRLSQQRRAGGRGAERGVRSADGSRGHPALSRHTTLRRAGRLASSGGARPRSAKAGIGRVEPPVHALGRIVQVHLAAELRRRGAFDQARAEAAAGGLHHGRAAALPPLEPEPFPRPAPAPDPTTG